MTRKTRHHRETARTADGSPVCFASECAAAAGNQYAGSYSAYCSVHQVRRPEVPGAGWQCPVCLVVWGRLRDHDDHQVIRYDQPRAVTCLSPTELDVELVLDPGTQTWLTPQGLRKRAAASARLRSAREATSDV